MALAQTIRKWNLSNYRRNAKALHDDILTDEALEDLQTDIFGLSVIFVASKRSDAASQTLNEFFQACNQIVLPDDILRSLHLFKSAGLITLPAVLEAKVDTIEVTDDVTPSMMDLSFLEGWSGLGEVLDYAASRREDKAPVDETYDRHKWRTSDDPWDSAICARLLCQTSQGELLDKDAVEEAFEAIEKLFTFPPKKDSPSDENDSQSDEKDSLSDEKDSLSDENGGPSDERPQMLYYQIPYMKMYFLLAIALGRADEGRDILRLACKKDGWKLHELLDLPITYRRLDSILKDSSSPPVNVWTSEETDVVVKSIVAAVRERQSTGRQEPLHGVPWPELLQRYAKAAFSLRRALGPDDEPATSPEDILLPPASEQQIQNVEAKLGPLPPDLREMVSIASGFRGGWHFAAGGFAGIDELDTEPASENETWLDIEPVVRRTQETITLPDGTTKTVFADVIDIPNSTGTDWGPVWVSFGAVECDDYTHIICPPETWRKIQGEKSKDGEYRVTYYSCWGGKDGDWNSMRHWVADLTAQMELDIMGSE